MWTRGRGRDGQRAGPRFRGHSGSKTPCQGWATPEGSATMPTGLEALREREGVLSCLARLLGQHGQVLNKCLSSESMRSVKAQIQMKGWRPDRNAGTQNRASGMFKSQAGSWDGRDQWKPGHCQSQDYWGSGVIRLPGLLSSLVVAATKPAWPAWALRVTGCICRWGADYGGCHFCGLLCFHMPQRSCQTVPFSGQQWRGACPGPSESLLGRACRSTIFQTGLHCIASWSLSKVGFCRLPNLFC